MDHRLKTIWPRQSDWQCFAQFKPWNRQPAFVLDIQVNFDGFPEEGMAAKMAFDLHLSKRPSGPPQPGGKSANNQIDQCQREITPQESSNQQKHKKQRQEITKHMEASLAIHSTQVKRCFFQHIFQDCTSATPAKFRLGCENNAMSQGQRDQCFDILGDHEVPSTNGGQSLPSLQQRQSSAWTDSQH